MFHDRYRTTGPVKIYGFLVSVEAEEGTSLDLIIERLSGAATFVEGVGHTNVEYAGELEDGVQTKVDPAL